MPRLKKASVAVTIRMDAELFDRMTDFCAASGQSKTAAIERAVGAYIDEYEASQRVLEKAGIRGHKVKSK